MTYDQQSQTSNLKLAIPSFQILIFISTYICLTMFKTITTCLVAMVCTTLLRGQLATDSLTNPIVAEGKLLYRSEMASWYGTDLVVQNSAIRPNIGGYFSYTEAGIATCVFVSKAKQPKVIAAVSFDSTYNIQKAVVNTTERAFTAYEATLWDIRQKALQAVQGDTLFQRYTKTNFNFIPIISNGEKKVYILTGPEENGVVIFGNDYLLSFDSNNQLLAKKRLHKNIISIAYGGNETADMQVEGAVHSHLPETGAFITATDICTLMLYEKMANWKQHTVISNTYVSMWNCLTNTLLVLPKAVIEKINKDKATKPATEQ